MTNVQLTDRDLQRFVRKVAQRETDACWPWTAGVFPGTGYGAFWLNGTNVGAHRVAAHLAHGAREGMVLHSCDNPPCCNPAHLRYGTAADNMRDRTERDRAPRGEQNPNSKLTAASVAAIRERHANGESLSALAREFGVTPQAVHLIVRRITWKRTP